MYEFQLQCFNSLGQTASQLPAYIANISELMKTAVLWNFQLLTLAKVGQNASIQYERAC